MNIQYYLSRESNNLKEMINNSARDYGTRIAFRYKQGKENIIDITYNQFQDEINALGTSLINLGLKDKHIAILSENRYEWITSYLSVINGTGVVVPIDRDLPEKLIEYLLNQGDVEAIYYSSVYEDIFKSIEVPNIKYFISFDKETSDDKFLSYKELMNNGMKLTQNGDESFLNAEINSDVMASILFTSGTTGLSKGVMLSHKNIISNIMGTTAIEKYDDHNTLLSVLPYHHCFECTVGIMASLNNGATICINDSLKYFAKNMQLFKPDAMFLVPALIYAMYKRVAEAEKSMGRKLTADEARGAFGGRIKRIYSGSAPLKPEFIKLFKEYGIELCQGYGMTETSPVITSARYNVLNDDNLKTCGILIPEMEVKISDGEILVKGTSVMLGYYKNEQATAEVFDGEWLKTGDLGYLDDDGFLYISGRKKNVIIASGGENVYPEEIEQALYFIPLIADAIVYGGDGEEQNVVTAVILPNMDAFTDKTDDEIKAAIKSEVEQLNMTLPLYKQIAAIKYRKTSFLKTTSNKIKRCSENTEEV